MRIDIIWSSILRLLQRCYLQIIMLNSLQTLWNIIIWYKLDALNNDCKIFKNWLELRKSQRQNLISLRYLSWINHMCMNDICVTYTHIPLHLTSISKHKNAHFATMKHRFLVSTTQVAKLIRSQVLFRHLRQLYVAISQQLESVHLGRTYVACHTWTMGSSPDVLGLISDMASLSLVVENVIRFR